MPRLLSELLCGHCRRRFWPRADDSAASLVHCPHCAGPHANPSALAARPGVNAHPFAAWLNRHWLETPPEQLAVARSDSGVDGGLPWCVVHRMDLLRHLVNERPHYRVLAFVAASFDGEVLPGAGDALGKAQVRFGRHGAWLELPATPSPEAHERTAVEFLLRRVRERGGRPLPPLEEVPDPRAVADPTPAPPPDPERDRAVESETVRCGGCGAPLCLAQLVGDARCPYCGAGGLVDAERAREFRLYVRRHAAAGLQLHDRAPSALPGGVSVACTYCGAPNAHRPTDPGATCGSCSSALIPPAAARQRALEARTAQQRAGFGSAALEAARDEGRRRQQLRLVVALPGAFGAAATLGIFLYTGSRAVLQAPLWVAVAVAALGALALLGAAGVGLFLQRQHARRAARQKAQQTAQIEALATQLAMTVSGPPAFGQWVRAFWNDRVPGAWTRGPFALTGSLRGLPVAVLLGPPERGPLAAFGGAKRGASHLDLVVATTLRPEAPGLLRVAPAAALGAELERAGFRVELRTAGLVARLEPMRARAAFEEPTAGLGGLGRSAHVAAALAHALGTSSSSAA